MKGVSNLQRMEEHTNAAVGRVEMMELMMLKREMAQELPHLRTLRSTVHGLNDRVKALEVKQNLMRQNLEIAMQVGTGHGFWVLGFGFWVLGVGCWV